MLPFGRKGVDLFLSDQFSCIGEAGVDVVPGQVVVFLENLLDGPAASKQIDDELHGDAGAFDDGLAHKDIRVDGDAFVPVHMDFPIALPFDAAGRVRFGGELTPSVYTRTAGKPSKTSGHEFRGTPHSFWASRRAFVQN